MFSLTNQVSLGPRHLLAIHQLTTADLEGLALLRGVKAPWQLTREALISVVSGEVLRHEMLRPGPKTWQVENVKVMHKPATMRQSFGPPQMQAAFCCCSQHVSQTLQGVAPERASGAMVSHDGDLYVFGGVPSSHFLAGETGPVHQGTDYIVKLSRVTHKWEPVSSAGAPRGQQRFEVTAGASPEPLWCT